MIFVLRSLGLSLFFVLIVGGQTFAMEKYQRRDFEQRQEFAQESPEMPLQSLQFKYRTVLLPDNQANRFSITFDMLEEPCVTYYQLGGKSIARLLQIGDAVRFQDYDEVHYDFVLHDSLKAGLFDVLTKGKFTFKKPVETYSSSLTCKAVEFLDKFESKQGLTLDVDYCDNFGDVSCNEMLFKGNQFNVMTDAVLTTHDVAAFLLKKGFFNDGNISCAEKAIVASSSIRNPGSLSFGNLGIETKDFLNTGLVAVSDSLQGSCESWDDRGRLNVQNDCVLDNMKKLSLARSSLWKIGKNWKANIDTLHLRGKASVGMLALLTIGFHAQFDGSLEAPIIHVDSNDFITCNFTSRLLAAHYVGLSAKGWLEFKGDIFKQFLRENEEEACAQKLGNLLEAFPRGVYLTSEHGGIKKSGTIIAQTGTVSLDAKKGLMHTGVTEAGCDKSAALLMTAADLTLDKNSLLDALNARLNAQTSLDQSGKARIQQLLMLEASDIGHHGSTQAATLCAKANNITASVSSHINVEAGVFEAQQKIDHAGSLAAHQFAMNARDIDLQKTSHVDSANGQLKASESITNQGSVSVSQLLEHAKYVTNSGTTHADRAYIKADRRWWNKWGGVVDVTESCNIDALVSCNTLGAVQASNLTINAGIDLNLLGLYRAENTNINALLGLNVGVLMPKFDSLDDLLSKDNAKKLGWHIFTKFVPQVGVVFSLKNGAENIYNQGRALYAQCQQLYESDDAGTSDVISLLCGLKNVGMSAYAVKQSGSQACSMAKNGWQAAQHGYQTVTDKDFKMPTLSEVHSHVYSEMFSSVATTYEKLCDKQVWKDGLSQVSSDAAGLFGPQVNRDMVFDINCGGILGVNGQSHSLLNANYGVSGFANKNTVNTYSGVNHGVMGAAALTVSACNAYATTGKVYAATSNMEAKNLDVNGTVDVYGSATFKAKERATIDADITADEFDIHAKTAELKKDAQCIARGGKAKVFVSQDACIDGKITAGDRAQVYAGGKATISGDITGKEAIVHAKDAELKEGSRVVGNGGLAAVMADTITSKAFIQGQQTQVEGRQVTLEKGSHINSQGGDETTFVQATEKLNAHKDSIIDGGLVGVDAQSFHGEDGNILRSRKAGHLKTAHLDSHGAMQGNMTLQFDGTANDLQSIGTVDHLTYAGTLEGDLADRFAQGDNGLLHIQKSGSIGLMAGDQEVHFKQQHDGLQHSVMAVTNKSVRCDKKMTTDKQFVFDAKENVYHKTLAAKELNYMKAGKKIFDTAQAVRVGDDDLNYEDTFVQSEVLGYQVYREAGEGIYDNGTRVHSGPGGTKMVVNGKLIAKAIECHKHEADIGIPYKTGLLTTESDTMLDLKVQHIRSEYTSDGGVVEIYAKEAEFDAPIIGGTLGTLLAIEKEPQVNTVTDCHIHLEEHTKKVKGCAEKVTSNPSGGFVTRGMQFVGPATPVVTSHEKLKMTFSCDTPEIVLNAPTVECAWGKKVDNTFSSYDKSYWLMKSHKEHDKYDSTYEEFSGKIITNAKEIYCDRVDGREPTIVSTNPDRTMVYYRELHEKHIDTSKAYLTPTPAGKYIAITTAALLAAYTGGALGAALPIKSVVVKAMVAQSLKSILSSGTVHAVDLFASCDGEYKEALKQLVSKETAKRIAVSAFVGGATAGVGQLFDIAGLPHVCDAQSLLQKLAYAVPREVADASIRVAGEIIMGNDIKCSLKNYSKLALSNSLGIALSSQIGHMYGAGDINFVAHKALHALNGAMQGAIHDGRRGAYSGALGAGLAEMVADVLAPVPLTYDYIKSLEDKCGAPFSEKQFAQVLNDYNRKVFRAGNLGRFTAATVALCAGQNTDIARNTASLAIDNNFLVLAGYGLLAYSGYQVYKAYKKGNFYAACGQLGIEVGHYVVGAAVGRVVFKVGAITYPTLRAATVAALEMQPGLKFALGGFADTLVVAGERFFASSIGKQVGRLTGNVARIENKIIAAENKAGQWISDRLTAGCKDLVDCSVPGSVLNKIGKQDYYKQWRPLGRGNTASLKGQSRVEIRDLQEQLLMEEIMVDPSRGKPIGINKGMTDRRWPQEEGWVKKGWYNNDHMRWEVDKDIKIIPLEVHYVAQEVDGVIKAVDDFKIVDKNMPKI